jgi:hypothetical protein
MAARPAGQRCGIECAALRSSIRAGAARRPLAGRHCPLPCLGSAAARVSHGLRSRRWRALGTRPLVPCRVFMAGVFFYGAEFALAGRGPLAPVGLYIQRVMHA